MAVREPTPDDSLLLSIYDSHDVSDYIAVIKHALAIASLYTVTCLA